MTKSLLLQENKRKSELMRYTVLCVGKIKEKYFTDAVKEYEKRLSRYGKLTVLEMPDERTPDGASEAEENQIRKKEADRLLAAIKDNMYVIALDLKGREYDSTAFSKHLDSLMLQGKSHIAFVIGGSLGLHSSILEKADESVSFSKMTFPHQLMRVILLEQVYRANRIRNNEPYHK
jgi:23S rRNA (pseudouridine1915-N3)-methyltransferase